MGYSAKKKMSGSDKGETMGVDSKQHPGGFLISTVVTVLVLGITSLWHPIFQTLRKIWLVAGEYRQGLWDSILDTVGEDQFTLWIAGAMFNLVIWYWIVGGLYTYLDVTLKPEALRKYKIQPGHNEPLDKKRLNQVIKQVLYNQFIVGFPTVCLGAYLFIRQGPPDIRQLPPFHIVFFQMIFFLLEQEFTYYYVHRLIHTKYLYKIVHKRHHEWTAPIAISAIYCHPIEQIFANLLPPFLGVYLVNGHLTTYWLWFFLAVLFTLSEHSGYHLPFMTSPEVHDFHHYSFNNNYGFLGILDGFHKTDIQYKNSMAYPRHFILKGLKSARELIPDTVKEK